MTTPPPSFANEVDEAQYWIRVGRDGTPGQKIEARSALARIFERRGMFEEATELLISNVQNGLQNAEIFRWLARLYRAQGIEVLAMQAAVAAAKYLPVLPVPATDETVMIATPADARAATGPTVPVVAGRRAKSSSGLSTGCLVAFILMLLSIAGLFGISNSVALPTAARSTPPVAGRSGTAQVDLGRQSIDFGSQRQARELLALIEQQPEKASYNVAYTTDIDAVVIGCDFSKDIVARVHMRPDNHGTAETWAGYLLDRLKSAAAGGSLNDTPTGKIGGTFETF
jgi:hypothetical protein